MSKQAREAKQIPPGHTASKSRAGLSSLGTQNQHLRQTDERSWEKTTGPGNRAETLSHHTGPESFNFPEMLEVPELGKKG